MRWQAKRLWLRWSTSPRRDLSERMTSGQKRKKFADRDEAAIFAVESEEIADSYRDTVEMGFGGAVFFFVDIKAMYERFKS
jgi:hypothetical protein